MKKLIVVFLILLGCSSSYQTSYKRHRKCSEQLEFIHLKYLKIDSILQRNGAHLIKADSVFQVYKENILNFFSNNQEAFSKHDTIYFGISYQSHSKIGFTLLTKVDTTIRKDIITKLNETIFPSSEVFDSSLAYCVTITGNIIKSSNLTEFLGVEYAIGSIYQGGRSRASIMRTIMYTLAKMRYAYNESLRKKPGLQGRITIRFIIDQEGTVVYARVASSTVNNCELEKKELDIITKTKFDRIEAPIDYTTVVYPFVFSFDGPKK